MNQPTVLIVRRITRWTAALAAVLIALPANAVGAATPQRANRSSEPTTSTPTRPAPLKPGDEIIQSWAAVPGGSNKRSNLTYDADGGSTIKDSVTVQNYGNVQLNLRVYATDAINTVDGQFDLLAGDKAPTDVGSWVSLAQENVTVPAGQQVTIPFTLTIPPGALPGDHIGGIAVSSRATSTTANGNRVIVDRRTGVRLYLRVRGELRSNLVVENLKASYRASFNPWGGRLSVRYRIVNRGNVRQAGTYRAELAGAFGSGRHRLPETAFPELLPGQSVEVFQVANGIPAYFVATARIDITPSAGGDAALGDARVQRASVFAPPVLLLVLAMVLLAGFIVRRLLARRNVLPEDSGDIDDSESENEQALV